jgi:hypothetical protein
MVLDVNKPPRYPSSPVARGFFPHPAPHLPNAHRPHSPGQTGLAGLERKSPLSIDAFTVGSGPSSPAGRDVVQSFQLLQDLGQLLVNL